PGLTKALTNLDENVRWNALKILGNGLFLQPDPKLVEQLVPEFAAALQDDSTVVRLTAVNNLGRLGVRARPALPALEEALQDPSPDVRQSVLFTLNQILDLRTQSQ